MTIEQVKSLLSRFYEGRTMPDEERLLADFFNMSKAHVACLGGDESGEQAHTCLAQDFHREDVPAELHEDKQLFLMLAKLSDQEMPADIAEEITVFVNNLGQTEKESVLPEAKQPKEITYRLKTPPKMLYRVAATVAILLALGGGIIAYQKLTDPYRDTCASAEEAAVQIRRANDMIANASGQCLAPTNKALQQTEATKQLVNQYINF